VSARGSVQVGCDYATALNIEVDPQRRCFDRRESDFALQGLVACRALETEVRFVCDGIPWFRCDGIPAAVKCASVSRWACRKRRRKNSPCMQVDVLMMAGRKEIF